MKAYGIMQRAEVAASYADMIGFQNEIRLLTNSTQVPKFQKLFSKAV